MELLGKTTRTTTNQRNNAWNRESIKNFEKFQVKNGLNTNISNHQMTVKSNTIGIKTETKGGREHEAEKNTIKSLEGIKSVD